jgi:hypothetical protein
MRDLLHLDLLGKQLVQMFADLFPFLSDAPAQKEIAVAHMC